MNGGERTPPPAAGHEARHGRRLWLVRHGETTGNSAQRYLGATDVPLSDVGRSQVRRLVPLLAERDFGALVHSPLSRAAESARILLDGLRSPPDVVEVEPLLREVDFGDLEGHTAEEIAAAHPEWYGEWQVGSAEAYPGGESLAGFAARIAGGIDHVTARHPECDLLVVVHRGVIKMALAHLLKLTRGAVRSWSLDLGSVSIVVDDDGGGWTLERYNLVGPEG